jgi:2-iminobutanoate/2-iminopropanoate deaminase
MTTRKVIISERVAKQTLPIPSAVSVGNLVFCSGIVGFRKDRSFAKGDFREQARQALENVKLVLEDAGSSMDLAVKVNVTITGIENFPVFNEVYRQYFKEGNYPARATTLGDLVNPDLLIEVECIAELARHG